MIFWYSTLKAQGIGDRTPQSLSELWTKETGEPTDQSTGPGYTQIQIVSDAIERAGTLDREKVNAVLAQTDMMTINQRVKFDENQFSRVPVAFGQWFKTDKSYIWEFKCIFSQTDLYPVTAEPIFPIPYK